MIKVLMVTSEATPFAKTGGLADVLGSLPKAINDLDKDNVEVRVIMPKYSSIPKELAERIVHKKYIFVKVGLSQKYCGIEETRYNGVTFYFIDNEDYFKREGLYGYYDDGERFSFFCRAVLDVIPHLDFIPDILHCHDWQTGMIAPLLEIQYRGLEDYKDIATMFTIHNLRFQGVYGIPFVKDMFGLGDEFFTSDKLEFYGGAGFLKGGLVYSNILTTVSPTYAEEIQSSFLGERLDGLLRARNNDLHGIVNGIDYKQYDPVTDSYIYINYDVDSVQNKVKNKVELQKELNLPVNENIPLIGLISRLDSQKGLDIIIRVFNEILEEDLQFVILGTGDPKYELFFKEAAINFSDKLSANIKFDNILAHKIYAASDLFLMPSLFEPCGLGQLISMRYGSLPIVRETGGLKDTVRSYNDETKEGNGFSFTNYNAEVMLYTIRRALAKYKEPSVFQDIIKTAMTDDNSWYSSAKEYLNLYITMKG